MARQHDIDAIRRAARPLTDLDDVSGLLDAIGDARLVLLGEATHGTQEFYRLRGELTRRLIEEPGVDAVAVGASGQPLGAGRRPRWTHYFEAVVTRQFDAAVHLDTTQALATLDGADAGAAETQSDEAGTYPTVL